MKKTKMRIETKVIHAGIEKNEFGAVVPPIYQTSTFEFKNVDEGAAIFAGEKPGYIYTRIGNPTTLALEKCVAALEGGYASLACASGMAAINTVFACLLKKGDHVICTTPVYGATLTLLRDYFNKFGVEISYIDTSDLLNVRKSIRPNTKIIILETPANPTLTISDIAAISNLAHKKGILVIVDNTFATPVLQRPLELGADIVVHSMTKYLNGHADVVAGIIVARNKELFDQLKSALHNCGGVIDPFSAFLVHRGIKTLVLRMERHCANGLKVARFLENHPKVKWVCYPGLKSHPQYELAKRQMSGPGGMISFELKGGFRAGKVLMNSVRLCILAVSLGGVETLIEHPASMTHCKLNKEQLKQACITEGLVRISVGIEDADDIIADLAQALNKI